LGVGRCVWNAMESEKLLVKVTKALLPLLHVRSSGICLDILLISTYEHWS
jgi:hypothetical protein